MRILVFMPRNMRFGASNASSVDLCVRDLITASRYRNTTTVVCRENETLFPGIDVRTYPADIDRHRARKARFALEHASKAGADLIVVQQHLPTAAALARRVTVPVILHKHNMTVPIARTGLVGRLRRQWRLRQYRSLAGIVFVSNACRDAFEADWPEVQTPLRVVYNGLDFSEWRPSAVPAHEIICVGRAAPEKGIREAAQAMAAVLSADENWRGRLVLSEPKRFPGYLEDIIDAVRPVASRVTIECSQPAAIVRQRYQEAAIAIVPSIWEEPFGRTALEAHAAGCAVISACGGGLPEINADNALILPRNFDATDIAERLRRLMQDRSLCIELARKGRHHCEEKFAMAKVASAADDFYDLVVRGRQSSAMGREEAGRRDLLSSAPVDADL